MLRCPLCRKPFESSSGCGFAPRREDGTVDMTTDEQRAHYDPVVADYERRRAADEWGGDDLDLPESPVGHREYWAFRRRSFRALDRLVRKKTSGGAALDVGAGNCWLTRNVDRWGFDATALDIDDGSRDGLRAGAAYLPHGDHFDRVRGVMTDLPFVDASFDLVVTANALHWSPDLAKTLSEFRRVMKPGAIAIVADSPWFEHRAHGRRRVEDSIPDLTREPALEPGTPADPFLYRAGFDRATRDNGMAYRLLPVFFGFGRTLESLTARFYQRALARFPLIVVENSRKS